MKIIITGAAGMLALDVADALRGHEVRGFERRELDITDEDACREAIASSDVVINCAAYTAVDDAESHEDDAMRVNADGARALARACRAAGARLVHISTDYVFRGDATTPYAEDAPLDPVSAYGRSKAAGEEAIRAELPEHYIVRTAWLYGAGGGNFVKTMARLARTKPEVSVVDDQRGQPTYSVDLARQIVALIESDAPFGTYHGTNSGETTWFGFARAIFEGLGVDASRVKPTDSAAFTRPAPRPSYSVLGHDAWQRAGLAPMRDWREALADALAAGVADDEDAR